MDPPLENPLHRYTEHSSEWWGAVYQVHSRAAYRGALAAYGTNRVSCDAAEAGDVVQEVFATLIDTRAIGNKTDGMGGYIYRCAYHKAIDRIRRQQKIADPPNEDIDGNEWGDMSIDDGRFERVEDLDELRRQAATARANVGTLTNQERRVARMLGHGLTREQIAFNEGVSKTRITHIKNGIRTKLQAGYGLRKDGTRRFGDE